MSTYEDREWDADQERRTLPSAEPESDIAPVLVSYNLPNSDMSVEPDGEACGNCLHARRTRPIACHCACHGARR